MLLLVFLCLKLKQSWCIYLWLRILFTSSSFVASSMATSFSFSLLSIEGLLIFGAEIKDDNLLLDIEGAALSSVSSSESLLSKNSKSSSVGCWRKRKNNLLVRENSKISGFRENQTMSCRTCGIAYLCIFDALCIELKQDILENKTKNKILTFSFSSSSSVLFIFGTASNVNIAIKVVQF